MVVVRATTSVVTYVIMAEAGHFVMVEGQAVMVDSFVVKTVEVVIS